MLSSLSSNVVLAKARAKYGKRLKEKEYRNLLDCKSVAEVAAYLKANTDYHDVLTGINEYDIHRGQLEVLIKQKLFYNLSSFVRYELSVGEQLADYVIARAEIEEILDALMLMSAGRQEEYSQAAPLYLAKHTKIRMEQFSSIQTYGEFLDALGSSVYRRLLAPFEPKPGEPVDVFAVENQLYSYLFSHVQEIIDHRVRGKTKKEVRELFQGYIDLENYARIIRMKKRFRAHPEFIEKNLLPFGSLKPKQLNALIHAENANQAAAIFRTTSRGKKTANVEYNFVDELAQRIKFISGKHYIHFSSHPPVVLLSYIFLADTEVHNITTIVEGIRYQVSVDDIKKLLILPTDKAG